MKFCCFILVLLCFCWIPATYANIQILEISEGTITNRSISNGIQLVRGQSKIDVILTKTLSIRIRGMWQWYDAVSMVQDFFASDTEVFESEDLDSYKNHIVEVRPLGSPELTTEALSLYEGSLYNNYPFAREHYFTEDSWTGEPFPLGWYVYTGWSNWTLYEGTNFTGNALCLEAYNLFGQNEADKGPYPRFVGSVVKGCSPATTSATTKTLIVTTESTSSRLRSTKYSGTTVTGILAYAIWSFFV